MNTGQATAQQAAVAQSSTICDAVVVGAGMAGLYQLVRLRELGLSTVVLDAANDVGGTWYWNRYPGARCDIITVDYQYSFDPDLLEEWEWSEKYATQPEILRYLEFVADKHDLRRDIRFNTRVVRSVWDATAATWTITTAAVNPDGTDDERSPHVTLQARYLIMATGCLSVPKEIDIDGVDSFDGEVYVTGRWPHEPVDFTGKRVAVIGTGSSAIQSIPIIAEQAQQLTVFQRTPNYSMPAHNGPVPADRLAALRAAPEEYREVLRNSAVGVPNPRGTERVFDVDEAERQRRFEEAWQLGELLAPQSTFSDLGVDERANDQFAEFVRNKIRATVADPEVAERLCPKTFPYGTKRPCLDTNYYETFNQPHVELIDIGDTPIASITATGLDITQHDGSTRAIDVDVILFATGFDAMTGAVVSVDIVGRDGQSLRECWEHGPVTYLGLMTVGFPNLFMITGPGSPSVLSNMSVSIEQDVHFVSRLIEHMNVAGDTMVEPTETAQDGWVDHCADFADLTLFNKADSWYLGANVPGKPRVMLPYVGGVGRYRAACDRVVEADYLGFRFTGPNGTHTNDGVVNGLKPDVAIVLETMVELGIPALETLSVADARQLINAANTMRPPGPDVAAIEDGEFQGAAGPLSYRRYVPVDGLNLDAPRAIILYFHGGGWVLGDAASDDPFCRDLCNRTGAIVVSTNYRHAPENPFPAAPDDALAALQWVDSHRNELGGTSGPLVVAGYSAGANLAAVVCQRARDEGGPEIAGALLVTPVTDGVNGYPSLVENAEGYGLTTPLMDWFWEHYCPPSERSSPLASPLLASNLGDLPPTLVVTSQFDPLRDQGAAYVTALTTAGTTATELRAAGQTHTSLHAVDVVRTAAPVRAQIAAAVREWIAPNQTPAV